MGSIAMLLIKVRLPRSLTSYAETVKYVSFRTCLLFRYMLTPYKAEIKTTDCQRPRSLTQGSLFLKRPSTDRSFASVCLSIVDV